MILINFTSNAFKNTRLGNISIRVQLVAGKVRLMVVDTGMGVPRSVETQLWQAFKQGSRWQSGTGLGLYHVKQLAEALGGSVGYQRNVQAARSA